MTKLWPAKLAVILLILMVFPLAYPLYYLGKIPVCLAAVYYGYHLYRNEKSQDKRFWYFLGIAILYNPLLPIHLFFSPLWIIADIVSAIYFYRFIKDPRSVSRPYHGHNKP
jgi:hypothetical protein